MLRNFVAVFVFFSFVVAAIADDGSAAFFWFDSQAISATGEHFYGTYAYQHLLPEFSPKKLGTKGSYAYFDGDFLPQSPLDIPNNGGTEATVAVKAQKLGSYAYAIAVYAYQGAPPFAAVDRALRRSKTTGYLGLTTQGSMTVERFVQLTHAMSLPVAMKQEGATLRVVNFEALSFDALGKLGFKPEHPKGQE